ncbi:MAG: PKD domain-containing protein [Fluviicola sp.]
MSQKLTTVTSTYSAFAKEQLLSHTDLNQVIDYFEDQDRLSRICLSGVGIVCGFKPTFIENENALAISQGTGVTTDGDLLYFLFDNDGEPSIVNHDPGSTKIQDYLKLTKFRVFNDTDANYAQFEGNFGQISLIELLPGTATGTEIADDPSIFENRTLLLYLDCYSKEPGACTAISCDSQGIEQVRVLRVLLVNDSDIDIVNKHDYLFTASEVAQDYLSLKNVGVPRVIVNDTNTSDAADLAQAYREAVLDSGMLTNLSQNLQDIAERVDYDVSALITSINNSFTVTTIGSTLFQYRYDLFKDLVDAYNELRALFIEHYPSCCPNIYPFPKHLWLGKYSTVSISDDLPGEALWDDIDFWEENNPTRHKFHPSPVLTNHYSARQHLISVFERMSEMVARYSVFTALSTDEIRITPSNIEKPISNRAIPFYYDPLYDADSNSRLVRLWDFKRGTLRQYDEILGYKQADESSNPLVVQPLQYNINPFDFYRIEGHQGLLYQDALERVNQIRDQFALGFDTKVLGISVDASQTINIDDYTCDFVDLQAQLETCKDMQYCLFEFASKLLSGYSIDANDEGFNHNTAELMGRQRIFTVFENFEQMIDFNTGKDTGTGTSSSSGSTTQQQTATRNTSSETSTRNVATSESSTATKQVSPEAEMSQAAIELQQELASLAPGNLADLNNPIVRNLYTEDDGLGFIVFDAFQRYLGTDSETTYQYMEFQIDNLTGPGGDLENWNDDIKDGNLYMPSKILSAAYAASLMIPDTLAGLTPLSIANYQTEIDRLCTLVRQYQSSYEKLRASQNTSINNDLYALSELLSGNMATLCCAGDKMQSILDQIEARKLEILTGLELAQFAEEHPGMEHLAGVPKGGTFIMAYAFNETGAGAIQNGTVIADFALPYLCCSDCRPVNFIVPKNTVSLLLSSSVVCIDTSSTETITIDTSISPTGGTLELLAPVEGVAISAEGKIEITPSAFNTSQLNVPIEFTVNGQFTDATLVVVEPATVGISTSPAIPTGKTDITSYVFYATGYGPDDTIIWDFGDGTTANGPVVSHTYALPVPNDKVTVQLTVIPPNGACPATSIVNISFVAVTATLDQTDFCEDAEPFPFTISPAGANPDITGTGVSSDQKFFDPGLTPSGGGSYTLYLNGKEFVVANVFAKPVVSIDASLNSNDTLTLNSQVENVDNERLRWAFFDPTNPEVELSQPAPVVGQPSFTISLQEIGAPGTRRLIRLTGAAAQGSPCPDAVDQIDFTVPA